MLLLLVGCGLALLLALRGVPGVPTIILFVSLGVGFSTIGGGMTEAAMLLLAQLLAGYYWGSRVGSGHHLVLVLLLAHAVAAILDGAMGVHLYQTYFPNQIFVPDPNNFRARGIVGQPVPAAAVVVWLAAVAWRLGSPPRLSRPLYFGALALLVAGVLWATGTRSAALVLLVLVLLILARSIRNAKDLFRVSLVVATLLGSIYAWATLATGPVDEDTPRILQFDQSVTASDSYVVRSSALEVIRSIPNPCGLLCELVGHGKGALQGELRDGFAVQGVSTVDNWYIALYWDFGFFGLLAVVFVCFFALRRFWSGTQVSSAGATGVLAILTSGLFYDAPYLSSGAILMGVFVALAMTNQHEGSERHNARPRLAIRYHRLRTHIQY